MTYLKTTVTGPDWIPSFECLIGDCPHTCCQNWNVEVDPAHGESLLALEDPEFRPLLQGLVRKMQLRRAGQKHSETVYRLNLLGQENHRCPIMNEKGACRLHLKYGPEVLCHTCYFFPRLFWQTDEQYWMTLDLACPGATRMAVCKDTKTTLARFEAEIDPAAEWVESENIADDALRGLIGGREALLNDLLNILQDRTRTLPERLSALCVCLSPKLTASAPAEPGAALFRLLEKALDWAAEDRERSFSEVHDLSFRLLAGSEDPAERMARNYREARDAFYLPYIAAHPSYEENFLAHLLISDGFKQFDRYQKDPVTAAEICHHEACFLALSYALFRVTQVRKCIETGKLDDDQFVTAIYESSNALWHYPLWFARCVDRVSADPELLSLCLSA